MNVANAALVVHVANVAAVNVKDARLREVIKPPLTFPLTIFWNAGFKLNNPSCKSFFKKF